ncbi:unnamed protein product [marine sediment metagenome]|uniref:Uncharacterized protein n=1 Tax=marine sediment metagenome TaxID=412755 RepID=X0ZXB5_9ZZZZ
MKVYCLTLEKKGDGSGNYVDYYRPGISLFTDTEKLKKILMEYIYGVL